MSITSPQAPQPYKMPKLKSPFNVQNAVKNIPGMAIKGGAMGMAGYGTFQSAKNIVAPDYDPSSSYDPVGAVIGKTQSALDLVQSGQSVLGQFKGLENFKPPVSTATASSIKSFKDVNLGNLIKDVTGKKVGTKAASEVGKEVAKKGIGGFLGKAVGKAIPILALADSAKTIASGGTTAIQKAGAGLTALSAVAATNFWNPAGWVAGALAVGGTLMQAFGGSKFRTQFKH